VTDTVNNAKYMNYPVVLSTFSWSFKRVVNIDNDSWRNARYFLARNFVISFVDKKDEANVYSLILRALVLEKSNFILVFRKGKINEISTVDRIAIAGSYCKSPLRSL